ncbi:MAG: hypothetical protein ACI8RD_013683, partial [Bacillariaceae sp.]
TMGNEKDPLHNNSKERKQVIIRIQKTNNKAIL